MSPFCTNCGRDLEESWKICPDCGKILGEGTVPQTHPTTQPQIQLTSQPTPQPHRVQPYQYKYAKVAGENKFGTASLVCGILGLVLGFTFTLRILGFPILRVVAVVLGGVGISRDDNKSMAIAGLVLGIIGLVIFFIGSVPGLFNWYYW